MKKVRTINTFLKLMSSKAVKLIDTEVLEYIILEDIPTRWEKCYYLPVKNTSRALPIDILNLNGTQETL